MSNRGFIPPTNESEKLVGRKIQDLIKSCSYTGTEKFTSFLNLREIELAKAELNHQKWSTFSFWGGHADAERVMLGISAATSEVCDTKISFPISSLQITPASQERPLSHRDYLGAILGLGIKRDCIGDILQQESSVVVFAQNSITPLLLNELKQVGRVSVIPSEFVYTENTVKTNFSEEKASVSSLRLDAVLSAILHINRSQSATFITKGIVQVNHMQISSQHYTVCENDIFSIRGIGKFKLEKIAGKSKKDRIFIYYLRYQ